METALESKINLAASELFALLREAGCHPAELENMDFIIETILEDYRSGSV